MDLDKWIAKLKGGEFLAEEELKALCELVKEVLVEESNVQPVSSPVTVRWGWGQQPGQPSAWPDLSHPSPPHGHHPPAMALRRDLLHG